MSTSILLYYRATTAPYFWSRNTGAAMINDLVPGEWASLSSWRSGEWARLTVSLAEMIFSLFVVAKAVLGCTGMYGQLPSGRG